MHLLSDRFKLKLTYFTKLPPEGVWCPQCEIVWEPGDSVFLHPDRSRAKRLFCVRCGSPIQGMPNEIRHRRARSLEGKVLVPDGVSGCAKCGGRFARGDEIFREQWISDAGRISRHGIFEGETIHDSAYVVLLCGDCGDKNRGLVSEDSTN